MWGGGGVYLRDTMVHDIEESGRNIKFDRSKGCLSKKLTSLGEKLGLMTVNLTLALISYFDKVVQPSYMYMLSVQIITGNALGLLGSARHFDPQTDDNGN